MESSHENRAIGGLHGERALLGRAGSFRSEHPVLPDHADGRTHTAVAIVAPESEACSARSGLVLARALARGRAGSNSAGRPVGLRQRATAGAATSDAAGGRIRAA